MNTLVLGLRVLLALACVIGLIWVLARRAGWGKGRRRPAGPAVEVIGRHAFGRHAGVAVVAVGDRRLLLGYGEQNVTMLTELDPADPVEAAALAAEQTADAPTSARAPLTLGALAAAVLPRQRGPRSGARSAAPAGDPGVEPTAPTVPVAPVASGAAFEVALSEAERTTAPVGAAAATAAASASAAAALAAAAAIPSAAARSTAAPAGPTTTADVPGLAGLEIADVDTASLAGLDRLAHPEHAVGETADVRPGALHGSVLAPSTWKQAVAALRERTVRR